MLIDGFVQVRRSFGVDLGLCGTGLSFKVGNRSKTAALDLHHTERSDAGVQIIQATSANRDPSAFSTYR
jgi:hypothetical protein